MKKLRLECLSFTAKSVFHKATKAVGNLHVENSDCYVPFARVFLHKNMLTGSFLGLCVDCDAAGLRRTDRKGQKNILFVVNAAPSGPAALHKEDGVIFSKSLYPHNLIYV